MGNAPAGQSAEEAKAAFESQTPEQKIKILESSPMGADEKKKRIDEVKKAAGMPVDSPEAAVPNGVPATNPPPGGSFPGDPRSAK